MPAPTRRPGGPRPCHEKKLRPDITTLLAPLSSSSSAPPPRAPPNRKPRKPKRRPAARRLGDRAAARFDFGARLFVSRQWLAVARDEHGLAVREQSRQRVAAHPRPIADRTAVDMNPGCGPSGVEADAARLHPHRDVAYRPCPHVQEMRVDRAAFHMLGMFRHLPRTATQHGVGLRRSIAR